MSVSRTDVHDEKTRSYNMSRIRGKDTKPEILVRKFLFAKGLRYKLHDKKLPGKPDIVLPKYKTIIFIHGCFWHGHDKCRYFVVPKTRTEWWIAKISRNKQLDIENVTELRKLGWKVIIIFECRLKQKHRNRTLSLLMARLTK
ncbi:MAG: very short patch repair endonuclease [Chloroflexi bacterium HGW-Chloroflexi-5]|jgi:DNA mismatch endonuclease (patch repair protein)|nr:MAG: very short patch repair endonuclease [Chloroflexi bacterium HGW-Chloroflexi-5]